MRIPRFVIKLEEEAKWIHEKTGIDFSDIMTVLIEDLQYCRDMGIAHEIKED